MVRRGVRGAIAERCDQAGVIGGAVMVDVVGADRGARDAAEQVIFFVGGAIRADEADRIGAVRAVKLVKRARRLASASSQLSGIELAIAADQRLSQALGMLGEIKSEAALDAQEFIVDAGEVAVIGAHDLAGCAR